MSRPYVQYSEGEGVLTTIICVVLAAIWLYMLLVMVESALGFRDSELNRIKPAKDKKGRRNKA